MKKIFTILFFLAAMAATMTAQVLPVEIISFTATAKMSSVILNWQTASEVSADRFEIQRRGMSEQDFITIGILKCQNKPSNYAFSDDTPLSTGAYYRLQQVDTDGKLTTFRVIFVSGKQGKLTVSPNPAQSIVNIAAPNDVTIFDLFGKKVKIVTSGNVDISDLGKGIYIIRVGSETARLVVQ